MNGSRELNKVPLRIYWPPSGPGMSMKSKSVHFGPENDVWVNSTLRSGEKHILKSCVCVC